MDQAVKDTVGIVGAGRMGGGLAQVCAQAGMAVVLVDGRILAPLSALEKIQENLDALIAAGKLAAEEKAAILARITIGTDFSLLKKCSLCVEAVIENPGIKSLIHRKIRQQAGSDIIIASNTASLSIDMFARRLPAADKFIGVAFGFPPQTSSEAKVICGPQTSSATASVVERFIRALGKTPQTAPDRKMARRFPLKSRVRLMAGAVMFILALAALTPWFGTSEGQVKLLEAVLAGMGAVTLYILVNFVCARGARLRDITRAMIALAADDLTVKIPDLDKEDEYGDIARLVDIFKMITGSMDRMSGEEAEKRRHAVEREDALKEMTSVFENVSGHIADTVAAAATQLQANARNLSERADQTSQQATVVAAATEEASASVQTVAAAAEELSASIGEINRQVSSSTRLAQDAVAQVKRTDATVSTLSEATAQIGDVVKLIQAIAEQTNLLALNATIEAARAGEAGKGFAVVASEVKNLANQTARATEEISDKIVTVQSVSTDSVVAIRGIGQTIEQISEISGVIASAMEQQTLATREISTNVQQASAGTSEVSSSIVNVTQAAAESRSASSEVLTASGDLSKQAESLRSEIQSFTNRVRSQSRKS
ncbi:MAG: 3-hydroxyacyl-CoA dehydrogenase NAD-binding domain-containing protein [Alphaproteobacteria bacterium]|nr:3-hydroxyacyl-CoA dehydrogenase NAD-binding domain-containing protein [Alphaproteobacteria bacterium]